MNVIPEISLPATTRSSCDPNWHKILRSHKSPGLLSVYGRKDSTALVAGGFAGGICCPQTRKTSRFLDLAFAPAFQRRPFFQFFKSGGQGLIFGAGLGGHRLDRLELLARDK